VSATRWRRGSDHEILVRMRKVCLPRLPA
jgi:hypothetical protein